MWTLWMLKPNVSVSAETAGQTTASSIPDSVWVQTQVQSEHLQITVHLSRSDLRNEFKISLQSEHSLILC